MGWRARRRRCAVRWIRSWQRCKLRERTVDGNPLSPTAPSALWVASEVARALMEDDQKQRPDSLLPYEKLIEQALRHVLAQAIEHVAAEGLPGGHHFYITFRTGHPGVELPQRVKAQYPQEMT